ncbi:CPBP family intramembrane glutamic endopeptidase [Nocardia sp. SC052]|uniref:CPBP family intramembrane glutamic endopeptidase n=1 Tax=Nocardia sichangensis TaxID=3385975 RepID=UPI00399F8A30
MDKPSRPLLFLGIVAALSIPFFVLAVVRPGGIRVGAMQLPVSTVIFVLPVVVAAALTWRRGGSDLVALLRRSVDGPAASLRWYALAVLLFPTLAVASHLLLRWAGQVGSALPLSLAAAPAVIAMFGLAATCEELGWTGYATDPLQKRFGSTAAAVGLGLYWASWHLVGWLQAGHPKGWIAGWFAVTIAARVLIVWLHNNTGHGVTGAILSHAALNVSAAYTPDLSESITTVTTGVLTCVVAVAVVVWPRVLRKYPAEPTSTGT